MPTDLGLSLICPLYNTALSCRRRSRPSRKSRRPRNIPALQVRSREAIRIWTTSAGSPFFARAVTTTWCLRSWPACVAARSAAPSCRTCLAIRPGPDLAVSHRPDGRAGIMNHRLPLARMAEPGHAGRVGSRPCVPSPRSAERLYRGSARLAAFRCRRPRQRGLDGEPMLADRVDRCGVAWRAQRMSHLPRRDQADSTCSL